MRSRIEDFIGREDLEALIVDVLDVLGFMPEEGGYLVRSDSDVPGVAAVYTVLPFETHNSPRNMFPLAATPSFGDKEYLVAHLSRTDYGGETGDYSLLYGQCKLLVAALEEFVIGEYDPDQDAKLSMSGAFSGAYIPPTLEDALRSRALQAAADVREAVQQDRKDYHAIMATQPEDAIGDFETQYAYKLRRGLVDHLDAFEYAISAPVQSEAMEIAARAGQPPMSQANNMAGLIHCSMMHVKDAALEFMMPIFHDEGYKA